MRSFPPFPQLCLLLIFPPSPWTALLLSQRDSFPECHCCSGSWLCRAGSRGILWGPVGSCGVQPHLLSSRIPPSPSPCLLQLHKAPRAEISAKEFTPERDQHHETPPRVWKIVLKTRRCFLEGGDENKAGLFSSGQGFCTKLCQGQSSLPGRFLHQDHIRRQESLPSLSCLLRAVASVATTPSKAPWPHSVTKGNLILPRTEGAGAEQSQEQPLAQGFHCLLPRPAKATQEVGAQISAWRSLLAARMEEGGSAPSPRCGDREDQSLARSSSASKPGLIPKSREG